MSLLSKDDVIKDSFKRFKEHMMALEGELRADREFLIRLNDRIGVIERRLEELSKEKAKEGHLEEEIAPSKPLEASKIDFEESEDI